MWEAGGRAPPTYLLRSNPHDSQAIHGVSGLRAISELEGVAGIPHQELIVVFLIAILSK